jgi:hypothetical protein
MNKFVARVKEKKKLTSIMYILLIFILIFERLELHIRYRVGIHITKNKLSLFHHNIYGLSIINELVTIIPAIKKARMENKMFIFDL